MIGFLICKNKKTAAKTHSLRDGAWLRGTTHIRPLRDALSRQHGLLLDAENTAEPTPFSSAARGRPSLPASEALPPAAPSLCLFRKILLPVIAIWVHYSRRRRVCQPFSAAAEPMRAKQKCRGFLQIHGILEGHQPKTASRKPAAMAEPMTPATLGPMACISRKLPGLAFCPST